MESNTGRRIKKSKGNICGWICNLKRGEIKFDKPVVLCLPGDGTRDNKAANGMAKDVERALGRVGVLENDIQILSVQYPKDGKFRKERYDFSKEEINNNDNIQIPEYIETIYMNVLQPLVMNAKGRRFSFDEAQTKFRNLTLFSHCHGTFVACKLVNKLSEEMKKYGYTSDEIKSLLSEIVSIGLSPRIGFNRDDGSTKFGFSALDDSLVAYRYKILIENAGNGCMVSDLSLCLDRSKNNNTYAYYIGDSLNYTDFEDNIFMSDRSFMHSVDSYINENYVYKNNDKVLTKNTDAVNFSHLIVKIFQNAVSLSKQGIKRTVENIVSNETPITFKQGIKTKNLGFIDIKFDGNNKIFEKRANDYIKLVEKRRFNKATKTLNEKLNDNVPLNTINKSNEK